MTTIDEYRKFAEECLRWADSRRKKGVSRYGPDLDKSGGQADERPLHHAGPNVIQPPADAEPEAPAD
jgi:hypothetical protein